MRPIQQTHLNKAQQNFVCILFRIYDILPSWTPNDWSRTIVMTGLCMTGGKYTSTTDNLAWHVVAARKSTGIGPKQPKCLGDWKHNCVLIKCGIFIISLCTIQMPGGLLNINMSSYQYREFHVKDKAVSRPSNLEHGNPHTWERRYLYWDGTHDEFVSPVIK